MAEQTQYNGRVLRGTVVAADMQNTVTVVTQRYVKHPKYQKFMRRTKKYLVHDAAGTAQVGDSVEIRECRPLSKRKRFTLVTK